MDNQLRWKMAQKYELEWWAKYSGNIDWYEYFSQEIIKEVSPFIEIKENTNILEIGSGPAGGITYINSNNKYAIDPLEDYFSTRKEWIAYRDKRTKYYSGKGENLPFKDSFFDLVILDNVLDHCENPVDVLNEINRVITLDGIIYFRQNVYNYWGKLIRSIMELFNFDKGHPFTFSKHQLENYFIANKWQIKRINDVGYLKTWINNINVSTLNGIVQMVLFITRNSTLFILQNCK